MSENFNPFDSGAYVPESQVAQPAPESTPVAEPTPEPTPTPESTPAPEQVQTPEPTPEPQKPSFEWKDDFAKTIYEKLVTKDVSELADMLYEQKVLSSLDTMSDEDVIKLNMAYEFPELTPEEIEEEYNSRFVVEDDIDVDMLTDEEVASRKKQLEKQQKAVQREMKKLVKEAKTSLQDLKKDIDFPDILSQMMTQQPTDEVVNQYLAKQQEDSARAYQDARKVFEQSIPDGLNSFDGFSVNYKDEDVQFDGKFTLTPEDKSSLQQTLQAFDLESFYGNRYYKEGKYDTKQLAEDVFFLQNREKIVNAMVTQAVSKAKADILKGMKNIDYSSGPRPSAAVNNSDYDEMVNKMFSL
jgi:hypothetical protein